MTYAALCIGALGIHAACSVQGTEAVHEQEGSATATLRHHSFFDNSVPESVTHHYADSIIIVKSNKSAVVWGLLDKIDGSSTS